MNSHSIVLQLWKENKIFLITTLFSVGFYFAVFLILNARVAATESKLEDNIREHTEFKVYIGKTDEKLENILKTLDRIEKKIL